MNCYVCAKHEVAVPAVATCRNCGAGLCMEHLREAAADHPAGGTTFGCSHDTWATPRQPKKRHLLSAIR